MVQKGIGLRILADPSTMNDNIFILKSKVVLMECGVMNKIPTKKQTKKSVHLNLFNQN